MRRLVIASVVPLLLFAGTATAPAKKRAKCAHYHEKTGCKLKPGDMYRSKSNGAEVTIYQRGFNVSDLKVKNAVCPDGTKVTFIFSIGTAEVANGSRAAKIGQTQQFTDDTTYILNGEDEVPVTLEGKVVFTSATSARLTGTAAGRFQADGADPKSCSAPVNVTLKRIKVD